MIHMSGPLTALSALVADAAGKVRSQSQQASYTYSEDLPSGSLDLGSVESDSKMGIGYDEDSGSVF